MQSHVIAYVDLNKVNHYEVVKKPRSYVHKYDFQ